MSTPRIALILFLAATGLFVAGCDKKPADEAAKEQAKEPDKVVATVNGEKLMQSDYQNNADPEVEAVMLGPEGVIAGAGPGMVVIDATSGTPNAAERMEAAAAARQVRYLDAPVSGGVKGALEGTLTLMVGGDSGVVEKVRNLLNAVARNIYEVGPVGAGRTLKAINQVIAGLNAAILCESLVLARKAGIPAETFLEVLGSTAADSYQLQTKLPQFVIPRKFDGGFRISLMLKDLDIALEMARQLQAPALLSSLGTLNFTGPRPVADMVKRTPVPWFNSCAL